MTLSVAGSMFEMEGRRKRQPLSLRLGNIENPIAEGRRMDWSYAGASITDRSGTPHTTLDSTATSAQINTAITNCSNAGGGIVLLQAGTYTLTACLVMKKNVTLRGEGVATILNFTALTDASIHGTGNMALVMEGPNTTITEEIIPPLFGAPHGSVTWTGTGGQSGVYTKGATVLNCGSAPTGLTAGDMVILAQDDAANASVPMSTWFMSDKNTGSGVAITDEGSTEIGFDAAVGAGHHEKHRVVSVSGSDVTIEAPGIMSANSTWATGLSPRLWWANKADDYIHDAGIEDFRLNTTSVAAEFFSNIIIWRAANCWVKGVALMPRFHASAGASDFGILIEDSCHISVIDSWVGKLYGGGSGGNSTSYAIAIKASSLCRIENNIFDECENAIVPCGACTGNAYLYNFDRHVSPPSSPPGEGGIQPHAPGGMMNLAEGNKITHFWADYFHGPSNFSTLYRNHTFNGGVDFASYNRWNNCVGNVLKGDAQYKTIGSSGEHPRGTTGVNAVGFRLGYPGPSEADTLNPTNAGAGNSIVDDSVVWTSTMLWGNFCTDNNTTRFDSSEVPSTDPSYPNPVPSSQALPASQVYSAIPAYFTINGIGTVTWPPIGPDVTGGDYMSGHAYKIPAERMYDACSGLVANFDPTDYGGH